ncbi:MAG: hypothetical protein IPM29_31780 [Planctomycetes bacterium]|nr:hypothetical protein [Planctomycetota bacterium]
MSHGTPPTPRERPALLRAAYLAMAIVVLATSVPRWVRAAVDGQPLPPPLLIVAPLLLAAGLAMQFAAKHRGSPLRLWSFAVVLVAVGCMFAAGRFR